MIRVVLLRGLRQLAIVPIVAIASYYLMALLPLQLDDESKQQLPAALIASYKRDLGMGEPFGFTRPWEKLFAGERLGTSAQGVNAEELFTKLSGSLGVGLIALVLALGWAVLYALLRVQVLDRKFPEAGELLPAVAFATPVFIPALLVAPMVVEAGYLLPELAAALVISIWPGVFLGRLLADGLQDELRREYVRTAKGKGLAPGFVLRRHIFPNVFPVLLDALGPVATALLAGSFAAERVLGLPYFGQLYVVAVLQKQIAVVVVATTIFASILVLVTLGVELARVWVDPRTREERAT